MHPFTVAFLVGLSLHVIVQIWLSARQIRYVSQRRNAVPAAFAAAVTAEEHAKAADYTTAKQRLGMLETVYDAAVVIWLTLGGAIALTARWTESWRLAPFLTGVAHVLLVLAMLSLLGLPFALYRTFWLEERFGFNRTTPATFITDLIKGWGLGALLGGAIIAIVLGVMHLAGDWWWLIAWAVWLGVSLIATLAWPRFIAPLFNKFSPLDDPTLRARIDALLERCGFHASGVFVMDGSRRSAHGNAYFTGFGREKRIVFFDTLLSSLTPPQVESVLAHELAHFKLRHVPKRLAAGAALTLVGFALLGWLSRQDWFYMALGAGTPSNAKALLLFALAVPAFAWIASPLLAAWSRRHEFEADAFAATYANGQELAHALVRLYRDNASTLTPDPLYSSFHDSHPPPAARIERLHTQPAHASRATAAMSA